MSVFKRAVYVSDRAFLWVVALPIMFVIQFLVGGIRGFVFGFSAAMAAWFLYVLAKTIAIVVVARWLVGTEEGDVAAICDETFASGDEVKAVVQLRELIGRDGETFGRSLALAGFLVSTKQLNLASEWIDRATILAPPSQKWRVDLTRAEWLRAMRRYEEALSLVQAILAQQPGTIHTHLEHAQVLAALGRWEQAEAECRKAKQQSTSILARVSTGRSYAMMLRKEVAEMERRIALRSIG